MMSNKMSYEALEKALSKKDREIQDLYGAVEDAVICWRADTQRALDAEKYAALWKRCAKSYRSAWKVTSNHPIEQEWNALVEAHCFEIERADRVTTELAALKNDARFIARWASHLSKSDSLREAIERILEATKEGE